MSYNEPPPEPPADQPPPYAYGGYGQTPPPYPPPPPSAGGDGYSATTAWGYGWTKFTQNLGQILVAVIVLVAVVLVVQIVGYAVGRAVACDPGVTITGSRIESNSCGGLFTAQNAVSLLFSLISWVLQMIIGAGIVRGAFEIMAGRQLDPKILLTPYRLGEVVVASLITAILTFVGFVLCIIPGLLVLFFTSFTLYFLMDREDLGAVDAIRASVDFTRKHAGDVIVWFVLSFVTYVVGFCLCGIGLVAAVPVIVIGTAYTYRKLNGQPIAA